VEIGRTIISSPPSSPDFDDAFGPPLAADAPRQLPSPDIGRSTRIRSSRPSLLCRQDERRLTSLEYRPLAKAGLRSLEQERILRRTLEFRDMDPKPPQNSGSHLDLYHRTHPHREERPDREVFPRIANRVENHYPGHEDLECQLLVQSGIPREKGAPSPFRPISVNLADGDCDSNGDIVATNRPRESSLVSSLPRFGPFSWRFVTQTVGAFYLRPVKRIFSNMKLKFIL
jgi:hypothetical protein